MACMVCLIVHAWYCSTYCPTSQRPLHLCHCTSKRILCWVSVRSCSSNLFMFSSCATALPLNPFSIGCQMGAASNNVIDMVSMLCRTWERYCHRMKCAIDWTLCHVTLCRAIPLESRFSSIRPHAVNLLLWCTSLAVLYMTTERL